MRPSLSILTKPPFGALVRRRAGQSLDMGDVTRVFEALPGDPTDAVELMPLLYEELRKLAAQKLASEPVGQTLQPPR